MAQKAEPVGATLEARLIGAFCRLVKSLSHSEQMGWLVGAVGIEQNAHRILNNFDDLTRNPQGVLPLIPSDLAAAEHELPPPVASIPAQLLSYQRRGLMGTWGTDPRPKRGRSVS